MKNVFINVNNSLTVCVVFSLLLSFQATAQTLVIDDFLSPSSNAVRVITTDATPSSQFMIGANSLGGTRFASIQSINTAPGELIFQATSAPNGLSGRVTPLSLAFDAGVGAGLWQIDYFGPLSFPDGTIRPTGFPHAGLGENLTGFDSIVMAWDGDRVANISFSLEMIDENGNSHAETYLVSDDPNVVPIDGTIFFAGTAQWDLSLYQANGVDLAAVDVITFSGNSQGSYDAVFGQLTAVPEASVSLLSILASGFLLFQRRRAGL